jgi:hypothetical protein
MHDDNSPPNVLSWQFHPAPWQVRRWDMIARHRGEGYAANLLKRVEAEAIRLGTQNWPRVNPGWLLAYRHEIRRVIDGQATATILRYLARCPRTMVPFGVWLLGKCSDRFRTNRLRDFSSTLRRRSVNMWPTPCGG